MRVCLHMLWSLEPNFIGGTERFVVELAKELKILGLSPFVLCTGPNDRGIVEGVEVVRAIPKRYHSALSAHGAAKADFFQSEIFSKKPWDDGLKALGEFVEEQISFVDYDILHFNAFTSAAMINPADAPVIVTNHENAYETDRLWGAGFFDWFGGEVLKRRTELHNHHSRFTPSHHYAAEYSKLFGLKISGVKLGVRLDGFPPTRNERSFHATRILLPSRFDPEQKGHDILVDAADMLSASGHDFSITFSGVRRDYVDGVSSFREEMRTRPSYKLMRFQAFKDINEAYDTCDIVVSPERSCSYGLSVSEALAKGVTTVLSDIPTYREVASGNHNAYYFKSGDAADLYRALSDAIAQRSADQESMIRFRCLNDMRDCAREYVATYLASLNRGSAVSRFSRL